MRNWRKEWINVWINSDKFQTDLYSKPTDCHQFLEFLESSDLLNMAEFLLKNNYFEFESKVKKQISGTAIGTKFALPYACFFTDKVDR